MDSKDDEPSPSAQADTSKRQQMDEGYTTKILFVLALLGVLLTINGIAKHYENLGFIYHAGHAWFWKGPYHVRAILFFNAMQASLALAVYVYGFDFVFKKPTFQRVGDVLYAIALIAPPAYLLLALYAALTDAVNQLSTPLFFVVNSLITIVALLTVPFFVALVVLIADRLQGSQRNPFADARKKFEEERSKRDG